MNGERGASMLSKGGRGFTGEVIASVELSYASQRGGLSGGFSRGKLFSHASDETD